MRYAAAVPAVALLSGSFVGVHLAPLPAIASCLVLIAFAIPAAATFVLRFGNAFVGVIALGFFAGATTLGSVAWQRAWRPPVRVAFEEASRAQRATAIAEGRNPPLDDQAFMTVEGDLAVDAARSANGVSLNFGGVAVTVVGSLSTDWLAEWRAGRSVRMPAQLHRPSRYLDPGVTDHERDLARRGTTLVGTVKSGALVEVLAAGGWLDEVLGAVRAFARRAIHDAVGRWSSQSAGIVAAIVIGDRGSLDPEIERQLQDAGTYHVIAISGGNIAILAGLLVAAFRLAGALGRTAMCAAIVVLLLYARLVGEGASVARATLMAVVFLGARACDQRSPPLNSLAVTASLLVISNPLSLIDPAFLLTFAATLSILLIVPAVDVSRLHRWLVPIVALFVASFAAEAMLLPLGASLFARVTFAGLLLNFAAIPLMAVAQIAGMAVVPLALVSAPIATLAGWIAHRGAAGLVWSADLVRLTPMLVWRVAPPATIVCAVYYTALGVALFVRRRHVRLTAVAVGVVAAGWIVFEPSALLARSGDGRLHATFLDVGQGDAIFVVFPHGSTLLVDAGGLAFSSSFDIGDRVVAPVIRNAGFRRIDRIALTHGDPDHIGGAAAIVREFRPREVWEGIPVPRSEPLNALRQAAQRLGARWANVHAGDRTIIDGVDVVAWHPHGEDWERQKVRNDDSLVLELRWRDVSLVLTGDIGGSVERTIQAAIPPAPLRVLKVPHHGSLTSSTPTFIAALHPQIAIVSAGRSNTFGHPAPEVLRRYEAAGARVFRTDRDGAIFVQTDGKSLDVARFIDSANEQR